MNNNNNLVNIEHISYVNVNEIGFIIYKCHGHSCI